MLAFIIYTLLLLYVFRQWPSRQTTLSPQVWTGFFTLKVLAIPAFYLIYEKMYGGVNDFDAGKFIQDARVINNYAREDFRGFLRVMSGLQNDQEGSADYENCLKYTFNWDNGQTPDLFYNDNRIVIRLHALLEFIAFDSFFVHALFSCAISFAGTIFLFRFLSGYITPSVKLLAVICFLPALWFYTAAPLKESLCVFIIGCTLFLTKKFFTRDAGAINIILLALLYVISCFLKPYLLLPVLTAFLLFFLIARMRVPYPILIFTAAAGTLLIIINLIFSGCYSAGLFELVRRHQAQFASVAQGGYFLRDSNTFVRLPDDAALLTKTEDPEKFRIKKYTSYTYWELDHVQDTLWRQSHTDTSAVYELVYHIPASGSNITHGTIGNSRVPMPLSAIYYALVAPHLLNFKGSLQLIAALENAVLVLTLFYTIFHLFKSKKPRFFPFVLLCTAVGTMLLIAFAAPNSGAIFRYRAPVAIFIIVAAVYYLPDRKTNQIR